MWRSRNNRDGTTVVCIACGASIPRSEAREYDKQGNRWERHGKSFEHLCKECYRDLCHQPRDELEALLIDVERAVDDEDPGERRVDSETTPGRPPDVDADRSSDTEPTVDRSSDTDADRSLDPGTDANLPRESAPDIEEWTEEEADRSDDAGHGDAEATFLAEYFRAVEERYGPAEEPGHES